MTPPIDHNSHLSLPLAYTTPGSVLRNSRMRPAFVCRLGRSLNAPLAWEFSTFCGRSQTPTSSYKVRERTHALFASREKIWYAFLIEKGGRSHGRTQRLTHGQRYP